MQRTIPIHHSTRNISTQSPIDKPTTTHVLTHSHVHAHACACLMRTRQKPPPSSPVQLPHPIRLTLTRIAKSDLPLPSRISLRSDPARSVCVCVISTQADLCGDCLPGPQSMMVSSNVHMQSTYLVTLFPRLTSSSYSNTVCLC